MKPAPMCLPAPGYSYGGFIAPCQRCICTRQESTGWSTDFSQQYWSSQSVNSARPAQRRVLPISSTVALSTGAPSSFDGAPDPHLTAEEHPDGPRSTNHYTKSCAYTVLIGNYEPLNEQPVAADSDLPFICLTDDRALTSSTWTVVQVEPAFPMDPIRSQRLLGCVLTGSRRCATSMFRCTWTTRSIFRQRPSG